MYSPDDWGKEFDLTLKYKPMNDDSINRILTQYKHDEILGYIKELWNLIDYQRKIISDQNKQLVAMKHKVSWKRYDKDESVFTEHIDKTKRSDTMGC